MRTQNAIGILGSLAVLSSCSVDHAFHATDGGGRSSSGGTPAVTSTGGNAGAIASGGSDGALVGSNGARGGRENVTITAGGGSVEMAGGSRGDAGAMPLTNANGGSVLGIAGSGGEGGQSNSDAESCSDSATCGGTCGATAVGAPCNTGELGVCSNGTLTCEKGVVECKRNKAPSLRDCSQALDLDCNGLLDSQEEPCRCDGHAVGATSSCTVSGACGSGSHQCTPRGSTATWSDCSGTTPMHCPPGWTDAGTTCSMSSNASTDMYGGDDDGTTWAAPISYDTRGGTTTVDIRVDRGCDNCDCTCGNSRALTFDCGTGENGISFNDSGCSADGKKVGKTISGAYGTTCKFKKVDDWTDLFGGTCRKAGHVTYKTTLQKACY